MVGREQIFGEIEPAVYDHLFAGGASNNCRRAQQWLRGDQRASGWELRASDAPAVRVGFFQVADEVPRSALPCEIGLHYLALVYEERPAHPEHA
jgi:hypothetical protein